MTAITARVVADSISQEGIRLTTMQMRYPRAIHAEFMTHRMFSRNARSSRAVPVETLIAEVMEDPFVPLHWGANQRGMQADAECDKYVVLEGRDCFGGPQKYRHSQEQAWLLARDEAVRHARAFHMAGYHKQIVNRLIEPFMHIDVVVTATDWANFFALRDHHMAEPHMLVLAQAAQQAMRTSNPRLLQYGEWHLPYVDLAPLSTDVSGLVDLHNHRDTDELYSPRTKAAIAMSVARCARVSYKPFGGESPSLASEVERHDLLVNARPMHASPCEHQAMADSIVGHDAYGDSPIWKHQLQHGNLKGWCQYRKMLDGECIPG